MNNDHAEPTGKTATIDAAKRALADKRVNDAKCETFTIQETAIILGVGRNSAYEAARRGEIPTIDIGNRKLVPGWWIKRKVRGEIEPA